MPSCWEAVSLIAVSLRVCRVVQTHSYVRYRHAALSMIRVQIIFNETGQ